MVPSETRESLYQLSDVCDRYASAVSNKILPASEEKILGGLAIEGLILKETGGDFVAELGISFLESEQLGVVMGGVG